MAKEETQPKARRVALKSLPADLPDPPDLPKDVNDMSSEDWTELNDWFMRAEASLDRARKCRE